MNRKSVERSLARYTGTDNVAVADRLAYFGPALLKVCDIEKTLPEFEGTISKEALAGALERRDSSLLAASDFAIDAKRFAEVVSEIAAAMREAADAEGELREKMAAVDFAPYCTEELVALAAKKPAEYLDKVEELAKDDELSAFYTLPALGFALRAFLDAFSKVANGEIERYKSQGEHDRPTACPTCGMPAAFAAVVSTPVNGNVKKLYCSCCGTKWVFERIRCASCGDMVVSDLEYVHDVEDQAHRLHVCKSCNTAMPTFFADGDEMTFSPDVEELVMADLEEAWHEGRA